MAADDAERRRWPLRVNLPRPVVDALAGAIAGGISRVVVSPLDVIKIRFQVQLEPIHANAPAKANAAAAASVRRAVHTSKYTGLLQATKEIFREEGLLGFWRGTVPGLLLVMPYCAIQFVVVRRCKALLAGSSREEDIRRLKPEMSFIAGAVGGVAATVGSYPFDLLRTVLASQGEPKMYKSMTAACMGIVRQRGIQGLFSGISPTIAEIIPYSGLQFALYDAFKSTCRSLNARQIQIQQRLQRGHVAGDGADNLSTAAVPLTPVQQFLCGLGAGILSKAICHPLDVVKKRFQVAGLVRHPRYGANVGLHSYNGMFDALRKIAINEGTPGLYKGLLPSLIKAAPAAAITFLLYEVVAKQLEALASDQ